MAPSGRAVPSDPAFAVAAIPLFAFCLEIVLRRAGELAGWAANPGACLILAAGAASLGFALTASRERRPAVMGIALLLVAGAAAAALAFRRLPDNGFDAQSYHLPSVLRLLGGWRPMAEATDLTLSNSYPSGLWTILAGFDALFGFESGRAVGLIMALCAGAAVWIMFRKGGAPAAQCAAFSLVLAANPVAVGQMFCALADGVTYELALILICCLMMMLEDSSLALALLAGVAMVLVCNVKLTGLYFGTIAVATTFGLLLLRCQASWKSLKDRRRQIAIVTAAGLAAVCFVGWRPYLTNVLEHHSIVYPPPSELGYRPGSATQVPPNLDGAGRGWKLAALIFARTDMDGGAAKMKIPGAFDRRELRMSSDTRNGGFGPFFGAATLLAFAALAWALVSRGRVAVELDHRRQMLFGLMGYGVLTTILFPEPWWARFVAVGWIVPPAAAWLAYELRPSMTVRVCGVAVVALLLLNSTIAGYDAAHDGIFAAADIEQKLDRMVRDPGPVYLSRGTVWNSSIGGRHAAEDVWRRRLADRGKVEVTILPREDCRQIEFLSVDVERCDPPPRKEAPSKE